MRIAIVPFNRGLAHITRSLMIGQALKALGHGVTCFLPENLQHYSKVVGIDCLLTQPLLEEDNSVSFEVHRNESFLLKRAQDLQKQLVELKPDLIVVDFHFPALIAAQTLGIKVVYITHTTGLPTGFSAPHMASGRITIPKLAVDYFSKRMMSKYVATFDSALQRTGTQKKHVFENVEYIIPEPHGYLKPKRHIPKFAYCGPILWSGFEELPLPLELNKFPKEKTVYITGGGTGFDSQFVGRVARALLEKDYWVVISTGGRFKLEDMPNSGHIFTAPFLPGGALMDRVCAVLCHGGYGTLVQAAQKGVPTLSIPVNVEQLIHGARFKELEISDMLWPFSLERIQAALKGDLGAFESGVNEIPTRLIIESIERTRTISVPRKIQSWFDSAHSSQKAAEYIQGLVIKK